MIALFIDYKPFGISDRVGVLDALCSHQFRNGDTTDRMFTALDTVRGLAFSQTYHKLPPKSCEHGWTFKHESGIDNPAPIPSFDTLAAEFAQWAKRVGRSIDETEAEWRGDSDGTVGVD